MKQREQKAQTEAADALQFLDESAVDQTAAQQETPNTGQLMAEQDPLDYDDQYDENAAYEENYPDYHDEDDDHAYDDRTLRLHFFCGHLSPPLAPVPAPWRWLSLEELEKSRFPEANRGVIERLIEAHGR